MSFSNVKLRVEGVEKVGAFNMINQFLAANGAFDKSIFIALMTS